MQSNTVDLSDVRGAAASVHLDLVRGLAAVAVLYSHARVLFMKSADQTSITMDSFDRALYMLSGYGHSAVIIFFVLSGFFIAGSVVRALRTEAWSLSAYLNNRCSRLYVVLVPCLLLTLFWDSATTVVSSESPSNNDTATAIITDSEAAQRLGAATFVGNLFFLQTILVKTYGSNTALWSLANEFWYYVIFPCAVIAISSGRSQSARVIAAFFAGGLLWFVGYDIAFGFLIWLAGAALAVMPQCAPLKRMWIFATALTVALVLFGVVLLAVGLNRFADRRVNDVLVAATFALLMYCILHVRDQKLPDAYSRFSRALSGFSFSLYAVHLPLLVFFRACFTREEGWDPR